MANKTMLTQRGCVDIFDLDFLMKVTSGYKAGNHEIFF